MGFKCGIVGLPNVGKSTLFNALTQTASAEAANYPFCTIEPNSGRVAVPDAKLEEVAAIAKSAQVLPTYLEFVDIAGLVKGASKGEGLGNQFLGHIRSVDAIVHVLRCFDDPNITHVEGSIDPIRDAEVIEAELMIADMDSLEKQSQSLEKRAKGGDKESKEKLVVIEKVIPLLQDGRPAREADITEEEMPIYKQLQLLTSKPILYVCNVSEEEAADGNAHSQKVDAWARTQGNRSVVVSAAIESEVAQLESAEEQKEFLDSLGLEETGLSRVIREGYALLDLITFFTVGPKEARAWTVAKNSKAPQAAGVIHTDFERGFICAELVSLQDFIDNNGEQGAKSAGKMRQEGRDYVVQDRDIIHFRFNV